MKRFGRGVKQRTHIEVGNRVIVDFEYQLQSISFAREVLLVRFGRRKGQGGIQELRNQNSGRSHQFPVAGAAVLSAVRDENQYAQSPLRAGYWKHMNSTRWLNSSELIQGRNRRELIENAG